jgi:hypothetical protein
MSKHKTKANRKARPAPPNAAAPFTDGAAPAPATMAVDAQPRAGDATPRRLFERAIMTTRDESKR